MEKLSHGGAGAGRSTAGGPGGRGPAPGRRASVSLWPVSQWGQPNQQWPGQSWPAPSGRAGYGQWPGQDGRFGQQAGPFGYAAQQGGPFPQYGGAPVPPRRRRPSPLKFLAALFGTFTIMVLAYVLLSYGGNGSSSDGSSGSRNGSYANEDYEVPPADTSPSEIPQPETYSEATQWMEDNPVYGASVAEPVRCDLDALDMSTATDAQLEDHLNELTACLMRVWGPTLRDAGYEAVRPTVTVYDSEISTPCGDMPMGNAAYCMVDQQVYYATDLAEVVPDELSGVPYTADAVMAHEFGHAVQARTGILYSEKAWESRVGSSQADEFSRRTEVQADCFAGEFIGSVSESLALTPSDTDGLSQMFYAFGDDVLTGDSSYRGSHGHGTNRREWFQDGLDDRSLATCNAFTAADSRVR